MSIITVDSEEEARKKLKEMADRVRDLLPNTSVIISALTSINKESGKQEAKIMILGPNQILSRVLERLMMQAVKDGLINPEWVLLHLLPAAGVLVENVTELQEDPYTVRH